MCSIQERENLLPSVTARETGFTLRPIARLALHRRPRNLLDLECQHVLRTKACETVHGRPPLEYRLWLEAGKLDLKPPAENPDAVRCSRVWRNFRYKYGDILSEDASMSSRRDKQSHSVVPETVASLYPIAIPAPSNVGEFTFAKFLTETPVIKNEKLHLAVLRQVQKDNDEFRRLRLRSELRDPPLTQSGDIAPPEFYRRYPHYVIPDSTDDISKETTVTPLQSNEQLDMFGRRVPRVRQSGSLPWKLEYRKNNPEYEKVKSEATADKGPSEPTKHRVVIIA